MAKASAVKKAVVVTLELSEAEARTILALCVSSGGTPVDILTNSAFSPRAHADAVKNAITDALEIDRTESRWYQDVTEFNSASGSVFFDDYPDNHPGIKGE